MTLDLDAIKQRAERANDLGIMDMVVMVDDVLALLDALETATSKRLHEVEDSSANMRQILKCDEIEAERDRLTAENAKLRAVVGYYANVNYLGTHGGEGHIALDRGKRARAYLDNAKEPTT